MPSILNGSTGIIPNVIDPSSQGPIRVYIGDNILLSDGTKVDTWPDASSSPSNAVQATMSNQPVIKVGYVNGKNAVLFDSTHNQFLAWPAVDLIKTVVVVAKSNESPFTDYRGLVGGNPAASNAGIIVNGDLATTAMSRGTNAFTNCWDNGSPRNLLVDYPFAPVNQWFVGSFENSPGVTQFGWIGLVGGNPGSRSWEGHIAAVYVFDKVLTPSVNRGIQRFLCNTYAVPYIPQLGNIIFDGNSLMRGFGASDISHTFPNQAMALFPPQYRWRNYGVDGQSTTSMISDEATQIYPEADDDTSLNTIVAWELTNEAAAGPGNTAAICVNLIKSYVANAKAHGFSRSVIPTMLPRTASTGGESVGSLEVKRQAINALLRADGNTNFTLLDLTVHPELEDSTNLTYFVDGVHLTDAGYAIVANSFFNLFPLYV